MVAFQLYQEEGVIHERELTSEMANHFMAVLNPFGKVALLTGLFPATFGLICLERGNGHSLLFDKFHKAPQLKLCSLQSLNLC